MLLLKLPVDILDVIFFQSGLDPADLAHLATLHSALYHLVIPRLYKDNIRQRHAHCLFWAAKTGTLRTLSKALSYGADPNTAGPDEADTMEMLEAYADYTSLRIKVAWAQKVFGTPLHFAASLGHGEIVAALLDAGADIHAPSRGLCRCAFNGSRGYRVTSEAEGHGMNESIRPLPNWLPLHHAVCNGHLSTANLLLDRGASLQMCYEPHAQEDFLALPSLVHCATGNGLETLVQRALEVDIRTALRAENELDSPLHYACESWNSKGAIRRLVAAGHDVNLNCGWPVRKTPLLVPAKWVTILPPFICSEQEPILDNWPQMNWKMTRMI
ncbi:hypothetical protein PG996_003997 [Apiospora saccharicola]|uniref:Ankyrin n=1 Tax=Apiospora saccharicola TaxID=335842 RepID=A0ABR1W453_9PEZI